MNDGLLPAGSRSCKDKRSERLSLNGFSNKIAEVKF